MSASVVFVDTSPLSNASCVGGCRHNADINADTRWRAKVCKERGNIDVNILFLPLHTHLSICRRGDGGANEKSPSDPVSCVARIARARPPTLPLAPPYGKIPRRGNNHPCGKPSRPSDAGVLAALRPERAEAAQNAPRSRRARQTAHRAARPRKEARTGRPGPNPRKSATVPPQGAPESGAREGAGKLSRVCFGGGKTRSGSEPP